MAGHGTGAKSDGRFILVMGVCGSGKSSLANALADALGGIFIEGDAFHPAENIARMSAGQPLTDAMRKPWLVAIARAARLSASGAGPVVIACSALKRSYRDILHGELTGLRVVHLSGERSLIAERMTARRDHFMPLSMLDSQLADLEPPSSQEAVIVDIANPPAAILRGLVDTFRAEQSVSGGDAASENIRA
ncbi:gluconokinase [Pararhizobium haloflavum]|uniref:gluconokinase n=1 Tax=Pararhizobium haloflavum TaxID=2037914 RepID=UPI000C188AE0|nr:gluconokinase [Pararhizobium haloflavum]